MSDDPKSKLGDYFPKNKPLPGMLKDEDLKALVAQVHSSPDQDVLQKLAAPLNRIALTQVAQELLKTKKLETCLALLSPPRLLSPRMYRIKFYALFQLERYKEAVKAARKVLAKNPDDHDVRDMRADCYEKLGRHVEALDERILSQRERDKKGDDITLHNLYLLRASYQLRINEPNNARGSLELAAECNDPTSESYFLSAEIALTERNYVTAVDHYTRALKLHEESDKAHSHFDHDLAVERLALARTKLNPPARGIDPSTEFQL